MGLVAEFEIHCPALPLVDVAASVPDAGVVIDIQFNHGRRPLFITHVTHDDPTPVEAALDATEFVDSWALVGRAGETRRYQIEPALSLQETLGDALDDLEGLRALATTESAIERIEVTPDGWIQSGWFANREAFDAFRAFWQDNAGFTLRRLTRDGDPAEPGEGLTDRQQEALRIAYEMGYFDIPREASLDDIAAELDISPSSLSERLRRAQTHLIETSVASTWPPLPDT
ncbi:DNA-binding protein [Halapricum sp. CBA1109]|uniref:helix-turn-helix domain-containing protein n=1 Tax=Halapricum sp. CBA1109 TaxID=2668068 RepID=UPI0012F7B9C0|nr:helix-turn-helix domain-containing protein [Halapricum sp. CBA1109]MUV90398.1 DNA-binding protein [Halapricum sp. CBA1109]